MKRQNGCAMEMSRVLSKDILVPMECKFLFLAHRFLQTTRFQDVIACSNVKILYLSASFEKEGDSFKILEINLKDTILISNDVC